MKLAIRVILFLLISTIFMIFMSASTSPLFDVEGADSMIFKLMSMGWLSGKIPYIDSFDHKGPYLYLIDMIGLSINQQWGILLLQIFNFTLSLELIYRIGQILRCKRSTLIGSLIFYILVATQTIPEGNLTEEWSLNFILLPLLLLLRDISDKNRNAFSLSTCLACGLCFGIISQIRINNAAILVACVLFICGYGLWQKRWREFFIDGCLMFGGLLIAISPALIYYWLHDGLNEYWHATMVFNVNYFQKWGDTEGSGMLFRILRNSVSLTPVLLLLILSLCKIIKKCEINLFVGLCCVVTYLTLFIGVNYNHYFTITLPLCFLFSVYCFKIQSKWKYLILLIGLASSVRGVTISGLITGNYFNFEDDAYYSISGAPIEQMIRTNVPISDWNDIYSFGLSYHNAVFLRLGVYPAGKYPFFQKKYPLIDLRAEREINNYLSHIHPKWMIAKKTESQPMFVEKIRHYQIKDSVNNVYLYHIISE